MSVYMIAQTVVRTYHSNSDNFEVKGWHASWLSIKPIVVCDSDGGSIQRV